MKENNSGRYGHLLTLLKGAVIGGTMLVPGVSGGTMAMILNIYDKLISAVSSLMKDVRKNIFFLIIFAAGGGLGMLVFSKPLLHLIETYTMPTMYFFMGAVVGGIPLVLKHAKVSKPSVKSFVYLAIGIAVVLLLANIPTDDIGAVAGQGIRGMLFLFAAGLFVAVGLVLPGISVSYMLLILGMYDETMMAISTLYMPYLIPLAIGLIVGIFATTKVIEKALTSYPRPTYMMILGFVLASVAEVFPGIPDGIQIPVSAVTFAAGCVLILLLSKKESENI